MSPFEFALFAKRLELVPTPRQNAKPINDMKYNLRLLPCKTPKGGVQ